MAVKHIEFEGAISCTGNRYYYSNGKILDKPGKREILPAEDGLYYLPYLKGIFAKGITLQFAFCYAYYRFWGHEDDFHEVGMLTDGTDSCRPTSVMPYYHIEVSNSIYSDFLRMRLIPGYSKYAISQDGKQLVNLEEFVVKEATLEVYTGRYTTSVVADNGISGNVGISRLVALAWLEYDITARDKDVDHIDEVRTNNHYSNLQFMTSGENVAKHRLYRKTASYVGPDYKVIDLDDPNLETMTFKRLKDVSDHIKCVKSAILKHLTKVEQNSVIHNRYVVWDNNLTVTPNLEICRLNRYSSSKGFSVIGVNTKTGETKVFNKVSSVLDEFKAHSTGITKKTLTTSLKQANKRVFMNGWYFIYDKDQT